MKFARLIAIVFSTAAFVASGCSRDGHPVRPISDFPGDLGKAKDPAVVLVQADANSPDMLIESHKEDNKWLRLVVTVRRSEVEGGCWYLETAKGTRYEPNFGEETPGLRVGKRLLVTGNVDTNMDTFCMIGPVFEVEKYEEIFDESIKSGWQPVETRDNESTALEADGSRSAQDDEWASEDWVTLKGYYGANDKGCLYIYNEKGIIAELNFVDHICPNISDGASIIVAGSYSLLTWSPCQMAPLFNVEEYEVIRSKIETDVSSNEL